MKAITKTQFKILYNMYNHNEYHMTFRNALQLEAAAKLADKMPDVFKFSYTGFKEGLLSISSFEDILKLIKYNNKYEGEM